MANKKFKMLLSEKREYVLGETRDDLPVLASVLALHSTTASSSIEDANTMTHCSVEIHCPLEVANAFTTGKVYSLTLNSD